MIKIFVTFMVLALCGCANFDARLNTAAQIHAATTRSVSQSLDAHMISSKDAEAYQAIAVNSSHILDSARELKDTDPTTAEGKLNLASQILGELNKYLTTLQKGAP